MMPSNCFSCRMGTVMEDRIFCRITDSAPAKRSSVRASELIIPTFSSCTCFRMVEETMILSVFVRVLEARTIMLPLSSGVRMTARSQSSSSKVRSMMRWKMLSEMEVEPEVPLELMGYPQFFIVGAQDLSSQMSRSGRKRLSGIFELVWLQKSWIVPSRQATRAQSEAQAKKRGKAWCQRQCDLHPATGNPHEAVGCLRRCRSDCSGPESGSCRSG